MQKNSAKQESVVDYGANFDIEQKLNEVAEKITTIEGWKVYIEQFSELCCRRCANFEISKSKKKSEGANLKRPIAVITAGQPGAGKTPLIELLRKCLKEEYGIEPVLNNADFFRFCVPGTDKITRDFPEQASMVTDPVVKLARKYLIEESINNRQSTIIENTLGDTRAVKQIMDSEIYDIFIAVLAVPREESLLSDFERYIKMKESCDAARLVSIEAHDIRYNALDKNINDLNDQRIRIQVYSRGERDGDDPIKLYDSSKKSTRFISIQESIDFARNQTFKKGISTYESRLNKIREKLTEFGMTVEEKKELEKLEDIINKVIEQEKEGWGYDD